MARSKRRSSALPASSIPTDTTGKTPEIWRKKLNTIFASITEAYSTLSRPAKRRRYDKGLAEKASRATAANLTKEQRAEILCADGHEKMQERKYKEAERLFSQAIYLDGSNHVHHYSLAHLYIENRQFTEGPGPLRRRSS